VAHEAHHRLHRRTRAGGREAPVLSSPVKAGRRPPPSHRFGGRSAVGFVRHHHHGRGPVRPGRGRPNRARAPRR
jgi:hypothetical protein